MITWPSRDLSRGKSGLPIGQLLFARDMSRHDVTKKYKKRGRNTNTLLLSPQKQLPENSTRAVYDN